jgi:hypothetical protein
MARQLGDAAADGVGRAVLGAVEKAALVSKAMTETSSVVKQTLYQASTILVSSVLLAPEVKCSARSCRQQGNR